MFAESCTANDIFELNNKKEYTLTATPILEKILTDNRLTNQAAKLWQYLFSKARYNLDISITISYIKLANLFNKNQRSIIRWANSLKKYGYLIIKNNFSGNGSQIRNTFFVRLPTEIMLFAKSSKNRKKYFKSSSEKFENYSIDTGENNKLRLDQTQKKIIKKTSLAISPSDKTNNDKNVMGEGDKNVAHNNGFKDNNNTNNNTGNHKKVENDQIVVFGKNFNNFPEALEFLRSKEKEIIEKINIENLALTEIMSDKNSSNSNHFFEKRSLILQLDTTLLSIQNEHKRINLQYSLRQKSAPLNNEISYIKNMKGDRVVSSFSIKRLKKQLSLMGYAGEILVKLINEIIFEIRFGSLIQDKDKNPLSIEKAINIGLKLVREGRWSTPTKIIKFLEKK